VSHNLLIDASTDPLREWLGAFRSLHQLVATGLADQDGGRGGILLEAEFARLRAKLV
jgi:hypothetical protein